MTVVISLLYYAGGSSSQQQVQNLQGALFFISLFLAFNGVFQVGPIRQQDRMETRKRLSFGTHAVLEFVQEHS